VLCKREIKFIKSCRSRLNPLKSSKLWQNAASRFSPFCLLSIRNVRGSVPAFTTFSPPREGICLLLYAQWGVRVSLGAPLLFSVYIQTLVEAALPRQQSGSGRGYRTHLALYFRDVAGAMEISRS
jgi:hypothetical protein